MGIGMQIAHVAFSGTASLECEAAMQLLRLQRYAAYVSDCCLSIESLGPSRANSLYEVRLFIGTTKTGRDASTQKQQFGTLLTSQSELSNAFACIAGCDGPLANAKPREKRVA